MAAGKNENKIDFNNAFFNNSVLRYTWEMMFVTIFSTLKCAVTTVMTVDYPMNATYNAHLT
jgi:hypothetical protein